MMLAGQTINIFFFWQPKFIAEDGFNEQRIIILGFCLYSWLDDFSE